MKEVDKNAKINISKEQGNQKVDGPDKKNDDEIKCSEDAITQEAIFKTSAKYGVKVSCVKCGKHYKKIVGFNNQFKSKHNESKSVVANSKDKTFRPHLASLD